MMERFRTCRVRRATFVRSASIAAVVPLVLLGCVAVASADEPLVAPTPAPSGLAIEVVLAGTMSKDPGANLASPHAYGEDELFLISHAPTEVFSLDVQGGGTTRIYDASRTPDGITTTGTFALASVAGDAAANKVYMVFTSTTLPTVPPPGLPMLELPDPDSDPSGGREDFLYIDTFDPANGHVSSNGGSGPLLDRDIYDIDAPDYALFSFPSPIRITYQVFVEWDYLDGVLQDPRPFLAFETQGGAAFHTGGGMVVAPDGRLVYATGDNLPFGLDGRRAPQDDASHLSKLLLIDPSTGGVEVVAKGLRNVQHIQSTVEPSGLAFTDIGGVTAEEVNFISWSDALDTSTVENFGWGRAADGFAREGTFHVGPGVAFQQGDQPAATGAAPVPEPGFRQPLGQYGRAELSPFSFAAASGPVVSDESFREISLVLGDLPSGEVYATTDGITGTDVPLRRVNLVDVDGVPVGPNNSLNDLAGGRSDPRFFRFPDGRAGVLLEATGAFYVLTERSASSAAAHGPTLSCAPSPPVAGQPVTCTVAGADPGIAILWRAAYDRVLAEAGVTLDASGTGTFSFVVPAAAVGGIVTVELVEWSAPISLGVVGGPVPASVPSGEGPVDGGRPARWLLGSFVLIGLVLVRRTRRAGPTFD